MTVVIPTHLRPDLLARAIQNVIEQTSPPDRILVVADHPDSFGAAPSRWETVEFLLNERQRGLSGAVNSALSRIRTEFVAIHDDDDWWERDFLQTMKTACTNADLAYCGIIRHEALATFPQPIPTHVSIDDLLCGNPGLQASNVLHRTSALLLAGGYDERLPSCTDRDLMIRLLEFRDLRVANVPGHLTHHQAHGHPRLSDFANPRKILGLQRFEAKHRHRMTTATLEASRKRAQELFGWDGTPEPRSSGEQPTPERGGTRQIEEIIVGLTASTTEAARRVLQGLAWLRESGAPIARVIIADNTPDPHELELVAENSGLPVRIQPKQESDRRAETSGYGTLLTDPRARTGIAYGRTILHAALFENWGKAQVAWILDDDVDLEDVHLGPCPITGAQLGEHLETLAGTCDIAVGGIHGDPPLPSAASLRVGLLDAWHAFQGGDGTPLDGSDIYHDLSEARYDHLETPQAEMEGVEDILLAIENGAPAVRTAPPRGPYGRIPTRGGNTFVFAKDCLADVPNLSPLIDDRPTRRGDTIWLALLAAQREKGAWKIRSSPVSVRQRRIPHRGPDADVLQQDILGACIVRALLRVPPPPTFLFDEGALIRTLNAFEDAARRKLRALRLNAWRIQGIARLFERTTTARIHARVRRLADVLAPSLVDDWTDRVPVWRQAVSAFLASLARYIQTFRHAMQTPGHGFPCRDHQAILGSGLEGVVVASGNQAVKFFHQRERALDSIQLELMRRLVAASTTRFVPVQAVVSTEEALAVYMPLIRGTRYAGGHVRELVAILQEARRVGIVHTNVHPDNLVVTEHGVFLVDPGRSLQPWTTDGDRDMAKRLYLSFRWHHRPDLKGLMTTALTNEAIPELFGFDAFHRSSFGAPPHTVTHEWVVREIGGRKKRVLDWGAGTGRLVKRLSAQGHHAHGYDRVDRHRSVTGLQTGPDAPVGLFDAVTCTEVLCEDDDEDATETVDSIRARLRINGLALISFCSPFECDVENTNQASTGKTSYSKPAWRMKALWNGTLRRDRHRPLEWYARRIHEAGFQIDGIHETRAIDIDSVSPAAPQLMLRLRAVPLQDRSNVTLLVKACAMEWRTIRRQVQHLVGQLTGPGRFHEIIVVTDDNTWDFARPHACADLPKFLAQLQGLQNDGIIDRVVLAGAPHATVRTWFGLDSPAARATNGQPTATILEGFDAVRTRYVLHVDSDILIHREPGTDPVFELLTHLQQPNALTAALAVAGGPLESSAVAGDGTPRRVEARFGMIDLLRLRGLLPLPNHVESGTLEKPWQRALDDPVCAGLATSWRVGRSGTWFVHVPNDRKHDVDEWMNLASAVEHGREFPLQRGHVDVKGVAADWVGLREEAFVFLVRGQGVPMSKWRRALDSIRSQAPDAGIILLDAGSGDATRSWLWTLGRDLHTSVWSNHEPKPASQNVFEAINRFIPNPETVVIQVDADDALLPGGMAAIRNAYTGGADLAIGGMIRTDKTVAYDVDLANPRRRGTNPWIHARTFKRYLFDAIQPRLLQRDGQWMTSTEDWAIMVPLIEAAKRPVLFRTPIYWYEPSADKRRRPSADREALIGHVMGRSQNS